MVGQVEVLGVLELVVTELNRLYYSTLPLQYFLHLLDLTQSEGEVPYKHIPLCLIKHIPHIMEGTVPIKLNQRCLIKYVTIRLNQFGHQGLTVMRVLVCLSVLELRLQGLHDL